MIGPKYKELNSQHNSLNIRGTEVGESISLQKRMNPRKRMYPGEKNIHMKNQIFIMGSQVERLNEGYDRSSEINGFNSQYKSEYHRTVEEAAKLMATGEA
jgi:hypothetical protein